MSRALVLWIVKIGMVAGVWTTGVFASDIALPAPPKTGGMSLQTALWRRTDAVAFSPYQMPLDHISQLCWAGQGISSPPLDRTSPTFARKYPLYLYIVVRHGRGIDSGCYYYQPKPHQLTPQSTAISFADIARVLLYPKSIEQAAVLMVITVRFHSMLTEFGYRGESFALMEVGQTAQNILLQATALGLGSARVAVTKSTELQALLSIPVDHLPLLVIPVGKILH